MKKLVSVLSTVILALGVCFGLTACGEKEQLAFGKELVKCSSQLDTLVQLDAGAIDVSIIDSVMAGFYEKEGAYAGKIQIIDNLVLAQEKYGIAGRKEDKAFMSKINDALIAIKNDGYKTVAETYGLTDSLCIDEQTTNPLSSATDGSWDSIKSSGKIVIGYTVFAPIAYEIKDGVPTKGFDIDLAKAVVDKINATEGTSLTVEFKEIDWDSKETLLSGGTIDLIWNGLTITEERSQNMCISVPYLNNNQVAVVLKSNAGLYDSSAKILINFNKAVFGVESGSAGESVVLGK